MDQSLLIFASFAMFMIGIIGVLAMRNVLIYFLSLELMLNAANLLFVLFAYHWNNQIGLAWVFFVLVIAAAEAAIGFALIIHLFRSKQLVDIDSYNDLKG
jgi:NADH-quinone oxidoreductase subunit K